jgi:universal stress protein E
MALNKIMVVVDPTTEKQPAFERALDSARLTGAHLHLYLCVNEESGAENLEAAGETLQPILGKLASRSREAGVETVTELDWAAGW